MKVFVTGGSGFLGQETIRQLKAEGHEVYALARSKKSATTVEGLGAISVAGDTNDLPRWSAQLKGIDAVVHAAAPVKFWGDDQEFIEGITMATTALHQASAEAGVERFIFISSESVVLDGSDALGIDETYRAAGKPISPYGRAKRAAEEALLASKQSMRTVIIRPSFIYGEGSPAMADIEGRMRKGSFPWINNGNAEFEAVHVSKVAKAISRALDMGKHKAIYFVSDEKRYTVRSFFEAFIEEKKLPKPRINLRASYIRTFAGLAECAWRIGGKRGRPMITRAEVDFLAERRSYDLRRSREDLKI